MITRLEEVILDIAAGPFGSNLKVDCFTPSGVPIIDGANLKGVKVTDNITKYVSEEKAQSLYRSIASRGDVVVTISGTVGQIAYIPETSEYEKYLISQRQFRVKFDPKRVYTPYLVNYFHTRIGQGKILAFKNQTGVPALAQPLKNFRAIEIDLPPLSVQKRQIYPIELLQLKIENNDRINKNLLALTMNIGKNLWSHTTNIGELKDICSISSEKISTALLTINNYYSTENILPDRGGVIVAEKIPSQQSVIRTKPGDTLISNIRPYFKKIFQCHEYGGCSNDVLCFSPTFPFVTNYLFSILNSDSFFQYIMKGAKGTKMPRGDKSHIMSYPIHIPSKQKLIEYEKYTTPLLKMTVDLEEQNKKLTLLKDYLLPRLLSGEIQLK